MVCLTQSAALPGLALIQSFNTGIVSAQYQAQPIPNPFAPKPAAPAPAPAAPAPAPIAAPPTQQQAIPNPFAGGSGSGAGTGTGSGTGSGTGTGGSGAIPNPFSGGSGSGAGAGTGTGGSGGQIPNPFTNSTPDPDQVWADGICHDDPEYGPNYMAVKDSSNGEWVCVQKPAPVKPKPCFGTRYTDPKTGQVGCCPRGTTWSFSVTTQNGACCGGGKTFKDISAPAQAGMCCGTGGTYGCSCKEAGSFLYDTNSCPVIHRNTRITPSGPRYELFCNVQTNRKDIKVEAAENSVACVDACGAFAGCMGVDFDKLTKQCYFKSEAMTESTEGAADNDVDSATMAYPTCDPNELCTAVDKKICNINGEPMQFFCGKGVWGTNTKVVPGTSIQDCAKKCQEEPKCQGVDFGPAAGQCYLKGNRVYPPPQDTADYNSVVPLNAHA